MGSDVVAVRRPRATIILQRPLVSLGGEVWMIHFLVREGGHAHVRTVVATRTEIAALTPASLRARILWNA